MKRPPLYCFLLLAVLATGCATQATLTIYTQPEGAFITERGTGTSFGASPVTVSYDPLALSRHMNSKCCFLVKGFDAHWVSGVVASLGQIELCGSRYGSYQITYSRDSAAPGLERDMQFALQVQAARAQQQQAKAAQDAALASLFQAWQSTQPVTCTSNQIGNSVYTQCR